MAYETILYDVQDAAAHITLNRPKKLNAMNALCIAEMRSALAEARGDDAVRVVVIKGAGERAFTAGADIGELAEKSPQDMLGYNRQWLALFADIESLPNPVIASVHGYATGGGTEMSLACDFVLCAENSRFGLSEINIGVIPGAGAAVRLTRWMGRLKAKEILMLGEFVSGAEAVQCGLSNRCVPDADLAQVTAEWAAKLAKKAPLALAAVKSCVNVGAEAAMPEALEYELREFLLLLESEDQKEGMTAFLEKREAKFTGR
jgi:enoyl-CoA hydratase/carnithine racemase